MYPRSLISVPIESAYATSYWSSIVISVLLWSYFAPFQRYRRFSVQNSDPTPIPPEFWGVSLGPDCYVMATRSEDPKQLIRAINFELV